MARYSVAPRTAREIAQAIHGDATRIMGDEAVVVSGITQDSRSVGSGDMYCCVVGEKVDGHSFAQAAVDAGATCLLVERHLPIGSVTQIIVPNVREAVPHIAAFVHGRPADALTIVGVTGTNGKTSTCAFIGSILSAQGYNVRVMGTLTGVRTTPEAIDLHADFAAMVAHGVTHVVMEVSSHALAQHRVDGVHFRVVVFTNLGRDHLDFHGTMEAYFAAKALLFEPSRRDVAVVNLDDSYGRLLVDTFPERTVGYSVSDLSDVTVSLGRVSYQWRGRHVHVPVGGGFTVPNSLAALETARQLGIGEDAACDAIGVATPAPGRFQHVSSVGDSSGVEVLVDYAHTPEGLENLLSSARLMAQGRVITVFGCGGDRDAGKRPLMGEVASRMSDVVVVTSDNPRSEDPESIVSAIIGAISAESCEIHRDLDRARAIESAISMAKHGDIVVIAGKGHEETQEINGEFTRFVDAEVASRALAKKGAGQ
jgi:UDP-N-acetylmuramoyl-L-alanyl-D-glutamate--2,6-diaminopimelate ligase